MPFIYTSTGQYIRSSKADLPTLCLQDANMNLVVAQQQCWKRQLTKRDYIKRNHVQKFRSSNYILGNFLTIFWEWKTEFSTNIVLGWLFGKKSEGEQPSKKCILWSGEGSWNGHNNDLTSTKLNLSDIKNTFRLSPQSWPFFILFIHMHLATYIGSATPHFPRQQPKKR